MDDHPRAVSPRLQHLVEMDAHHRAVCRATESMIPSRFTPSSHVGGTGCRARKWRVVLAPSVYTPRGRGNGPTRIQKKRGVSRAVILPLACTPLPASLASRPTCDRTPRSELRLESARLMHVRELPHQPNAMGRALNQPHHLLARVVIERRIFSGQISPVRPSSPIGASDLPHTPYAPPIPPPPADHATALTAPGAPRAVLRASSDARVGPRWRRL